MSLGLPVYINEGFLGRMGSLLDLGFDSALPESE